MYRKLKNAYSISDEKEIPFIDGWLEVNNNREIKSWKVTLVIIENGKFFSAHMRNRIELNFKFLTDEEEELQGRVFVNHITTGNAGVYIELIGKSPLD
ncbi:hypothetical protein [Oceanobacillus aidingensis]|uniref:Uncharacterized protein n=1 Tax=Oceanobacillus aidingensis TaxID=645964 RepID=A0ABV9JVH4_9BACI